MKYSAQYLEHNAEPLLPVALRCQCDPCVKEDAALGIVNSRDPELAPHRGEPTGDTEAMLRKLAHDASDMGDFKRVDNSKAAQQRDAQAAQAEQEIAAAAIDPAPVSEPPAPAEAAVATDPAAPAAGWDGGNNEEAPKP